MSDTEPVENESVEVQEENMSEEVKEPEVKNETSEDVKKKEVSTGSKPRTKPTEGPARQTRRMETLSKKLNKKAARMEQKDDRNFDNMIKLIAPLSIEDKFTYLSEKYKLLYQEVRKLEIIQLKYQQLQAENEQLNYDFGKNLVARSRLEGLCRDLQKQNRQIKDETTSKLREEEEKRKEVSKRFQKNFEELTALMEESNKKSLNLRDDNIDMSNKIQILCEKTKQMEDQMNLMKHESALEKQLYESNIAKLRLESQMEKEQWEQERRVLELSLRKSEEVRTQLQLNTKALQEQIQLYVKKCEDCEKTIRKSNKMFEKCKSETHGVTKKMLAMENDAKIWKMEWLKRDEEAETGKRKIAQLDKLCRRLQGERNEFLKLLRSHDIPIPSIEIKDDKEPIVLPFAPPIATPKERELAVLKNKLAELKDDLKDMDNENSDAKADAVIEVKDSQAVANNGSDLVENGTIPAANPEPAIEKPENAPGEST